MKESKSALMKWLARSLIRLIPMGESAVDFTTDVLPTLSKDVYSWWSGDTSAESRREELEAIANASPLEIQTAAEAALEDAIGTAGAPIDIAKREKVKAYLEQVPDAIRRSMKRPDDASGRTVPPHLAPRNDAELSAILPQRTPKFRAGDKPIPGVDIELVSALGAGGFGEVWRARKTHLGQDVALKFCLDPQAQVSLRNETALLRRLMTGDAMHPGIVRLLATYNDCSLLEYEFVQGGDLAGVIREWHADGKRPAPRDVIDAMRQIAEIVAFAHQLDPPLVHRDLKPANILVQRKSDGALRFRLTDFGIGGIAAASQVAAATQRSTTQSTSLQGSYSYLYASPQQMRAERPSPSDDVFSLGVIFWQLANGDLTDGAPGGASWMDDLKSEGYPASIVAMLASCFDRKPERRPKTAGVFAEALNVRAAPPPMKPAAQIKVTPPTMPATRTTQAAPAPTQPTRVGPPPTHRPASSVTTQPTPSLQSAAQSTVRPLTGPSAPNRPALPSQSAKWWIIGIVGAIVMLLSCIVLSILLASIDSNGDEPAPAYDPNAINPLDAPEPPDPRLQGWRTLPGDTFVTTTFAAGGATVLVVENKTNHFVIHQDGSRVAVTFNPASNLWEVD